MFKHLNTPRLTKVAASLAVATTVLASGSAMAAGTLAPSTADYNFTVEDRYKGSATRQLSKSGDAWNYSVNAKVSGLASAKQYSRFILDGNIVVPTSASTTYKIFGRGRTHKLNFSHAGKQVSSTYKGSTKNFAAPNRAYDDLSLEVQIRQDLLNNSFTGNYYMAKKDKVEKTPFRKVGNTTITVPAGTFKTVRVDRVHDDHSRSTSFWLAPSLDYLPVKVIQNNDGKKMAMELTKIR